MAGNVIFRIMTALGAIHSNTIMPYQARDKYEAFKMGKDKGLQLENKILEEECGHRSHLNYLYEQLPDGTHVITCQLPENVEFSGGKLRFKSKRSRKSLKKKRKSKRRKSLKKRKTSKRKYKR
tara:strand:+ start:40 stop:408 length:369 start_codon:yes stop_codon:yes gene_type:complete